jgi:hypothetical protein
MINANVYNHKISSLKHIINNGLSNLRMYPIFLSIYIVGGIAAIILSLIEGLNRGQIGFAFLAGSVLTIAIAHILKPQDSESTGLPSKYLFKVTITIWLFVFMFSLIPMLDSLRTYYLSLPYFISICVMSLIISYQILASQKLSKLEIFTILAEISLLAIYLSVSFIFLFPSISGGNDAYFHVDYITSIFNTGHLESYGYPTQYLNYPIYHLTMVNIMNLSGVDIKLAQLIMVLFQIFAILFIYLICDKIHFNEKISLLSTLLVTLSSEMIIPRYSLYPSNYSVIYYIFLLFIIFYLSKKNPYKLPITIVTLVVINIMHPILAFIVAFTLIILYVLTRIIRSTNIVDIRYVIASVFLMLLQYIRPIPGQESLFSLFESQITSIFKGFGSVTQATLSPLFNWGDVLLYDLGFTLLMAFGICGALLILRTSEKNKFEVNNFKDRRALFSSVALILIPIPYVLALINPNSLPNRWFVFTTVFLGFFSAITLYLYSRLLKKYAFLVIIIIQSLIFFSITAPVSNMNSQIYSEDMSYRSSYTLSEMNAVDFFKNTVDTMRISANSVYLRPIDNGLYSYEHFIDPTNITYKDHVLIVRNYDMDKGFQIPLFGKQGLLMETILPTKDFTAYMDGIDKFYENGEVRAFKT